MSPYAFAEEFKKRNNRAFKRKVTRYTVTCGNDHSLNFIAYCYRQADSYRESGFPFKALADSLNSTAVLDVELFTRIGSVEPVEPY